MKTLDNEQITVPCEIWDMGSVPTPSNHIPKIPLSPKLQSQLNRLRTSAAKLAIEIKCKSSFSPNKKITNSRFNDAFSGLQWAHRRSRVHQTMVAIADALEQNTCPEILHGIWQKTQLEELVFSTPDSQPKNLSIVTRHFKGDDLQFRKAQLELNLLNRPDPLVSDRELSLKTKLWELLRRSFLIPGFVPTPAPLGLRMIEWAEIQPGHSVLEPNGGAGAIALLLREIADIDLSVIEINGELRELLELMNFTIVGQDFLEYRGLHDRIVMNPPFENFSDADQIRHAFDHCLAPQGRIVALCSEGLSFRQDDRSEQFRDWLSSVGGHWQSLPQGSFQTSQRATGISARVIVLNKDRATEPLPLLVPEREKETFILPSPEEILLELKEINRQIGHDLGNLSRLLAGLSELPDLEPV